MWHDRYDPNGTFIAVEEQTNTDRDREPFEISIFSLDGCAAQRIAICRNASQRDVATAGRRVAARCSELHRSGARCNTDCAAAARRVAIQRARTVALALRPGCCAATGNAV